MKRRNLTARGVCLILTRAGVDYRGLTITQRTVTARDAWNGGPWQTYTEVAIVGCTGDRRRRVDDALYAARLPCAPYPDIQYWSR